MKIIVSHDIDHWRWSDHLLRDLYVPKFIARTGALVGTGRLAPHVGARRLKTLLNPVQHRLDDLIAFNNEHGVHATFFVAVAQGLSLAYSTTVAREIVTWLRSNGEDQIGLHGLAFDDAASIERERSLFQSMLGRSDFGIRMHYLRSSPRTPQLLTHAGYPFSSNGEGDAPPVRVGNLIEFPIGAMDARVLHMGSNDVDAAIEGVIARVHQAQRSGTACFTINSHDVYFSDAFPDHHRWYREVIERLSAEGFPFVTFQDLVGELRSDTATPLHPDP